MNITTTTWERDAATLEKVWGIHLPGAQKYINRANDADLSPPLTTANNGIPAQFTTLVDPELIKILVAPVRAAEIYGEMQRGTWIDKTMMFKVEEYAGSVSAYGDFNTNGRANININYPQRQQFIYESSAEWGDQEQSTDSLIGINTATEKRNAVALLFAKTQNRIYFYGIQGLQTYGTLTDPNLPSPIQPTQKASGSYSWEDATPLEIYNDVLMLVKNLMNRTKGILTSMDYSDTMTLAVSSNSLAMLSKANDFGLLPETLIQKRFPNMRIMSAPELSTEAGELVQLFIDSYLGTRTFTCGFSEKFRSHGIVRQFKSFHETFSQGSWGSLLKRPILVTQMLGV